jgi:hypothetical protein
LVEVDGKYYCKDHVKLLFESTGSGYRYASPPPPNPYEEKFYDERYCGPPAPTIYVKHDVNALYGFSRHSRLLALLLCFFFGVAGFHRFYVGKIGTGVLYLLTGGLFGIGWIIDLIGLLAGTFRDVFGRPLR